MSLMEGWFASASASATAAKYTEDRAWNPTTWSAGIAKAGAQARTYTGVQAGVEARRMEHNFGEAHLGFAADTGLGYKNGSLELKILESGFTIGNNTGISLLGSRISAKIIFSGWD